MATTPDDILHPNDGLLHRDQFPNAPRDWSPSNAKAFADANGLTMNDEMWTVVKALQEFAARHESINARKLHDALGEKLHQQGGMRYLYTLLPGGPIAQGCRLAGIEPPAGSVDLGFGSVQ